MVRFVRTPFVALVLVMALVLVACDGSGGDSTSTSGGPDSTTGSTLPGETTTTTEAPVTSLPPDAVPGETSPSISPEVESAMRADIGVLILEVEETRALPFLEIPTVTILDEADFTARVNAQLTEDIDSEEIAGTEALLKLLGMLAPDDDFEAMLIDLYTEQVAGFYDPETGEMVVPVSLDGITPLQEVVIAHELIHALTDQHFDFNDEYERRVDDGVGDDASAMLGLVEGDATYQQFLYLESLDPGEAAAAALEALQIDTSVLRASPRWLQLDLAFPYEQGLIWADAIIDDGGLRALDEAYQAPPTTTEQILDPNTYLRNEQPLDLAPLAVDLAGWELFDEATWGEWGTRLMLLEVLTPGNLAQATAGWGNDTYRVFLNGSDTAFVWSYLAETVEDAEDLTNALIAMSRDQMGATDAQESGGGLLFAGGDPYVFIDRIDDQIFYVASTDATAGADLRDQLGL